MNRYEQTMMDRLCSMSASDRLEYMHRLIDIAMAEIDALARQRYLEQHFVKSKEKSQNARPPLRSLEISELRLSPAAFPDLG